MIRPLHVLVFRYPLALRRREEVVINGRDWPAIRIEPGDAITMLVSFDHALQRLSKLPRMFVEPDGSFVWVEESKDDRWQVDGQLNDGPDGLISVELRGEISRSAWHQLQSCLGSPDSERVYQCVREGITLAAAEFERFVWGP